MMLSRVRRFVATPAVLLAVMAAVAPGAYAHASLVRCNIAKGAALSVNPTMLVCSFAEAMRARGSVLRVVEASGDGAEDDLGNSAVSMTNAHQMTVGLPRLGAGAYYVFWFTVAADGHKAGGVMPFTIK